MFRVQEERKSSRQQAFSGRGFLVTGLESRERLLAFFWLALRTLTVWVSI